MYGQYIIKIRGCSEITKKSIFPLSSMEDVFKWYANEAIPNPVNLPEERFEKISSREWRLIDSVGDCEMVVLKLID